MENNFAKNMTELRRQRGITQKQAAMNLGVSQALLSHYEKGVRECGLDFLIRAAEFYGVSCDTLLGVTELPSAEGIEEESSDKAVIQNSVDMLFNLLDRGENAAFSKEAAEFLMLSLYRLIRLMCDTPEGGGSVFGISRLTYRAMADAAMQMSEAGLCCAVGGQRGPVCDPFYDPELFRLSRRDFAGVYSDKYKDLLSLIKTAERKMSF